MNIFYSGKIQRQNYSEDEAWAIGDEDFLAEILEGYHGEQVFACYAFSPEPITPDRLRDLAILSAEGVVDARLSGYYSEITGWLWLDEDGTIGGHDLVDIFSQHEGEYGALVIGREPIDLTALEARE